ncbi:MAG: tetratricopeptide repeat protein, partial [Thermoguttaceae bacterium]
AAWVAQRKDMFAMLFFLLSILWYLNEEREYLPSPDRLCQTAAGRWYWLSLAAFVLAMLGKGSVAVLPVLLLEIVWWRRKISQWDLAKTAPFFLVAVVLAAVNMWFQTHGMEKVYRIASFSERLLGAGDVVWFYLYKDLLPFDLTFVYPQWHIQTYNPLWWLPLAAAVAVTLVLWRYRKRWSRPFLFAWGFFCVALVPVMGFTDVGFMTYSLVADHYQHIALIGVIALAAAGWNVWNQKARGKVCLAAMVLAIAAVGALTFLTWRQSRLYGNPIILYQDTLEKNPNSWLIHNNLGLVLAEEGRPQEAVRHYEKALELNPDYPKIHNNLGKTLLDLGRVQDAIPHLIRAVKLKPDYSTAYNNLGVALGDAGRPQEAIGYFEKAINLNPNYAEAHSNLSVVLAKVGRYSEAIDHCQQAIRIIPDLAGIYCNLASIYAAMHRPSESIAAAQKALELARIHGQKALARQIESQLNPYRASFSDHPNTSAPSKSAPPSL